MTANFLFYFCRGVHRRLPCDLCKKEFRSDKLKKHREVCKKRLPPAKPPKSQRKKETCSYCKKKFEKLHKHVCQRKRYKPNKKKETGIKKFFPNKKNIKSCSDLSDASSVETITISDEERSDEEQARQSDEEFLNDTEEIAESPTEHRRVDNERNDVHNVEVRERLRDLGMNIETDDPVECRWCKELVYNITQHESNCTHKKFPCWRCGVLFTPLVIKAHYKVCKKINKDKPDNRPESTITVRCFKCNKDISITNIKQHSRECKVKPKKKAKGKKKKKDDPPPETPSGNQADAADDDEDEQQKLTRLRKGQRFKLNFHGAKKYKILKRLYQKEEDGYKIKPWIQMMILGNEFGSGPRPHPHCHAVIVTVEKMNFEQFKKQWRKETKIKIADIQSSRNFSTDVKYCSKEDYRPIVYNIDWDLTSVACRAYVAAEKFERLLQTTYPYINLNAFQRNTFKSQYEEFRQNRHELEAMEFYGNVKLRPWQTKMLKIIEYNDSPREIIWLVDPVGNNGKTFLSYYLRDMCQAIRVPNVNSNDFAYAYQYQKIVVFDYTRESKDHINYDLLEDLKNGSIWSPKYQSAIKSWKFNAKVVCFANFPPKYEALSHDRWNVLELKDGRLRKTRAPQPQMPPTPYIVEETLTQDDDDPPLPTLHPDEPEPEPEPLRAFPIGRYLDETFVVIEQQPE